MILMTKLLVIGAMSMTVLAFVSGEVATGQHLAEVTLLLCILGKLHEKERSND